MINVNDLLKTLIAKKNNLRPKSFEFERTFRKCRYILTNFHPLEINNNYVRRTIEETCYALELHCLFRRAEGLRSLTENLLGGNQVSNVPEGELDIFGMVLFLLEINQASLLEDDFTPNIIPLNVTENAEDWKHILLYSDDIVNLTRMSYLSDSSSNYLSDVDEAISSISSPLPLFSVQETPIAYHVETHDCPYSCPQLEQFCHDNLQSEYWYGSNSNEHFEFLKSFEKFLSESKPLYYKSEISSRVIMTEYQFVREVLDVFLGAKLCTIWTVHHDCVAIANNRFTTSKSCKLSNLSWSALDAISSKLASLATSVFHLRVTSTHIIDHSDRLSIAPPILAFGERLHIILDEFSNEVRVWEDCSRGNIGLSIFELDNVTSAWATRLAFIDDILICMTSGRFESLHFHSTIVTLLDLLYRLMNESCLLDIDSWTISCVHELFFHSFRPYLFSLDALLCGQTHISSTNLFLTPNELALSTDDIHHYYYHHFTIHKTTSQSLVSTIPVLLHPFVVKLISTIKSIDLLRLISIELTKPTIVNAVVKVPGSFINHFNFDGENKEITVVNTLPEKIIFKKTNINPLFAHICQNLDRGIFIKCQSRKKEPPIAAYPGDLVESCRRLHHNLLSDISERYRLVNEHLKWVYIDFLGLKTALNTLKSVYFLQSGADMYEFTRQLFILLTDRHTVSEIHLHSNLKLQQVLSESFDIDLRQEAKKLRVKVSIDNVNPVTSEQSRMIAILCSGITVDYQVSWALKLIITEDILDICNRCLRFLLQLRFAKHCLETAIQSERHTILRFKIYCFSIHMNRMRALRLKLLQIINSFHIYIMNTFIVPSWHNVDTMLVGDASSFHDFSGFIHQVREPFLVMARGCLQMEELAKFRKAIDLVITLAVNAAQVNGAQCSQTLLDQLEMEHRRLIDFISAMFKGLFTMGISINGLDMGAFK